MRRNPTMRETMMRALAMLDSHVVKTSAQGTAVDVAGGLGSLSGECVAPFAIRLRPASDE